MNSVGINDNLRCSRCNHIGQEEECSRCGSLMGRDIKPIDQKKAAMSMRTENIAKFLSTVKNILEASTGKSPQSVASALNIAYINYVGPKRLITNEAAIQTLRRLMDKFPGFTPMLAESVAMSDKGKFFGRSIKADSGSHEQPTSMKEHGSVDRKLRGRPVNTAEKTPVMPGTEKSSGRKAAEAAVGENLLKNTNLSIMRENVAKLARHVRRSIAEGATGLRGPHKVNFTVLVNEGKGCAKRTMRRKKLAESIADLEELLQFHAVDSLMLEAWYINDAGISRKHEIQMLSVAPRGPVVAEGKAIFRFHRNAERFAQYLAESNVPCKITEHSWGRAVTARVTMEQANQAYAVISEYKIPNPFNWFKKKVKPTKPAPEVTKPTEPAEPIDQWDMDILTDKSTSKDIEGNPEDWEKINDDEMYIRYPRDPNRGK